MLAFTIRRVPEKMVVVGVVTVIGVVTGGATVMEDCLQKYHPLCQSQEECLAQGKCLTQDNVSCKCQWKWNFICGYLVSSYPFFFQCGKI